MAANIGFDSEAFNNMRTFTGAISEGEENVLEQLVRRLGAKSVSRAIRKPFDPPTLEDFKGNSHKHREAVETYEDKIETAFLILSGSIEKGSPLAHAVAHVLESKDPAELFQAIKKYYTAKTMAKALEIVTAMLRIIGDSRTKREVCTTQLSRLRTILTTICTPDILGQLSPKQIAERNLLEWKLFSELTPYAMQMLNERHVLYAAPFVQQHINTIRMDLGDVDFQALSIQYMAYCASSAEYRAQQLAAATPVADASGSKKRASEASAEDSSDAKRLVKVLTAAINNALDGRGLSGGGGGARGTGKAGRGGGGRNDRAAR
jgi:hypothetical protein